MTPTLPVAPPVLADEEADDEPEAEAEAAPEVAAGADDEPAAEVAAGADDEPAAEVAAGADVALVPPALLLLLLPQAVRARAATALHAASLMALLDIRCVSLFR
jgi:hypothetical protein